MTPERGSARSRLLEERLEPEEFVQKKVYDDGEMMPRIGGAGLLAGLAEGPVVQASGEAAVQASSADGVKAAAASGVSGGGSSLPHLDRIQQSFGHHDVSSVSAHTGSKAAAANEAMGSKAYATGNSVAFKSSPDLHTAAHEAAHIIQQRQGVSLKDGVGQVGDKYEKHADRVADAVVSGKSAASLLDTSPGGGSSMQRKEADGEMSG